MSDTPDTAVGASSAYDNAPAQTPAAISSAALANQMRETLTGDTGDGAAINAGVQHTVTQTPGGFPAVTFHTSGFGYDIPLG